MTHHNLKLCFTLFCQLFENFQLFFDHNYTFSIKTIHIQKRETISSVILSYPTYVNLLEMYKINIYTTSIFLEQFWLTTIEFELSCSKFGTICTIYSKKIVCLPRCVCVFAVQFWSNGLFIFHRFTEFNFCYKIISCRSYSSFWNYLNFNLDHNLLKTHYSIVEVHFMCFCDGCVYGLNCRKKRKKWKVERAIKWKWNGQTMDNNSRGHIKNKTLDPNEWQTIVFVL